MHRGKWKVDQVSEAESSVLAEGKTMVVRGNLEYVFDVMVRYPSTRGTLQLGDTSFD